jgi:hypothetical protein
MNDKLWAYLYKDFKPPTRFDRLLDSPLANYFVGLLTGIPFGYFLFKLLHQG